MRGAVVLPWIMQWLFGLLLLLHVSTGFYPQRSNRIRLSVDSVNEATINNPLPAVDHLQSSELTEAADFCVEVFFGRLDNAIFRPWALLRQRQLHLLQREMLKELEEKFTSSKSGSSVFFRVRSGGEQGPLIAVAEVSLTLSRFRHLATNNSSSVAVARPVLANLAVARNWRRRGLATTLVKRCEQQVVQEWGCSELLLQVDVDNIAARNFYASQGYVELFCDRAARRYQSGIFRGDGGGGSGGSGFGLLGLRSERVSRITMRKEIGALDTKGKMHFDSPSANVVARARVPCAVEQIARRAGKQASLPEDTAWTEDDIYVVEAFSSVDDATRATGLSGDRIIAMCKHHVDQKELLSGPYIFRWKK